MEPRKETRLPGMPMMSCTALNSHTQKEEKFDHDSNSIEASQAQKVINHLLTLISEKMLLHLRAYSPSQSEGKEQKFIIIHS
jgi:hypothetical protein